MRHLPLALLIIACAALASAAAEPWRPAQGPLMTAWAKNVSPDSALPEYPRPQMVRGVCGPNIVVASARDLALKGNTFADVLQTPPPPTGAAYGIDPACVLWLDLCDGVRLEENVIGPLGPCGKEAVHLGPGCRTDAK